VGPETSQASSTRVATGTITLLFTDLVGSTELSQRLGDDDAERVRRDHFNLLSQAVADAGGREVKNTGDGTMAVFTSALDALRCAAMIQLGQAGSTGGDDDVLAVRVGLNVGEAIENQGDYHGTAVNVASRLCQAARGGQIIASDLVRGLVGSRGGQRFRSLGNLTLKGLAEPVPAWEVLWREGEREATQPDDQREPFDAETLRRMPLPRALVETASTAFVGRTEDLAALDRVWGEVAQDGQRLAFVAGEPGIGKTRLCAEFCSRVHSAGAVVLYGRSDEETILPYQPFVESLSGLMAAVDDAQLGALLGSAATDMARMVPEVEDRLPGLGARVVDAETDRYRLFEAVSGVLGQVASVTPTVLVIDDLHWTDKRHCCCCATWSGLRRRAVY
jgi:class 3 adenylate cyclase